MDFLNMRIWNTGKILFLWYMYCTLCYWKCV